MYTLYTRWIICNPKMNFGVICQLKDTHELRPATHKICSLDVKLFLVIEKRPISGALSISKKINAQNMNDSEMCIKN